MFLFAVWFDNFQKQTFKMIYSSFFKKEIFFTNNIVIIGPLNSTSPKYPNKQDVLNEFYERRYNSRKMQKTWDPTHFNRTRNVLDGGGW